MTDVRELLGAALTEEPPTTIDPYAALAAGQARRRTRRHRWFAGGATIVVVLGVVAVVGAPRLRPSEDHAAASPPAATVQLGWVRTGPSAETGLGLDVTRTLQKLDGAAEQVQQLLSLPALDAARPYDVPSRYGALELAYRAGAGVEVHVLLQGPEGHPIADCAYSPPRTPDDWPVTASGARLTAPDLCGDGVSVATTDAGPDLVARTVAAWGTRGGQLSVTVVSDAAAPPPVTLAKARSVVDLLTGRMVFQGEATGHDPSEFASAFDGSYAAVDSLLRSWGHEVGPWGARTVRYLDGRMTQSAQLDSDDVVTVTAYPARPSDPDSPGCVGERNSATVAGELAGMRYTEVVSRTSAAELERDCLPSRRLAREYETGRVVTVEVTQLWSGNSPLERLAAFGDTELAALADAFGVPQFR